VQLVENLTNHLQRAFLEQVILTCCDPAETAEAVGATGAGFEVRDGRLV